MLSPHSSPFIFFFFNDTATTEIYTLSLHDALPISDRVPQNRDVAVAAHRILVMELKLDDERVTTAILDRDRKSTRLNSSHLVISYAVFCLKKKKKPQ